MAAPVYEPPRGRHSYTFYSAACAVGIVIVVWQYVASLVSSIRSGIIDVPILTSSTSDVLQPPGGAAVHADRFTLQVRMSDVPAGAVGYVRVADALGVVLLIALIALIGLVALKISRGGLFDATTPRILDALGLAIVLLGFVPTFVRQMGWNWVVSALGWDGSYPRPDVEPLYVPIYCGLLVVVCFRFALTASRRMVRDQAGLV